MKPLLIFYIPLIWGETDAVKAERQKIKNHIAELKTAEVGQLFIIIIVEDPARECVETEVHWPPQS